MKGENHEKNGGSSITLCDTLPTPPSALYQKSLSGNRPHSISIVQNLTDQDNKDERGRNLIENTQTQMKWFMSFLQEKNREEVESISTSDLSSPVTEKQPLVDHIKNTNNTNYNLDDVLIQFGTNCLECYLHLSRSSTTIPLPSVDPKYEEGDKKFEQNFLPLPTEFSNLIEDTLLQYFNYIAKEKKILLLHDILYRMKNIIEGEENAKARKLVFKQFFVLYSTFLHRSTSSIQKYESINIQKQNSIVSPSLPPYFKEIILPVVERGAKDVWSEIRKLNAKEVANIVKYLWPYEEEEVNLTNQSIIPEVPILLKKNFTSVPVQILFVIFISILNEIPKEKILSPRKNQQQLWRHHEGAVLGIISLMKEIQKRTFNKNPNRQRTNEDCKNDNFLNLNFEGTFYFTSKESDSPFASFVHQHLDGSSNVYDISEVERTPLSIEISYNLAFFMLKKMLSSSQLSVRQKAIDALIQILTDCNIEHLFLTYDSVIGRINSLTQDSKQTLNDPLNCTTILSNASADEMEALLCFASKILALIHVNIKNSHNKVDSCHTSAEKEEVELLKSAFEGESEKRSKSTWKAMCGCLLSSFSTVRQEASNLITKFSELSKSLRNQCYVFLYWFLEFQIALNSSKFLDVTEHHHNFLEFLSDIEFAHEERKQWEAIEGSLLCFESLINATLLHYLKSKNCLKINPEISINSVLRLDSKYLIYNDEEALYSLPKLSINTVIEKLCFLLEECIIMDQFETKRILSQVLSAIARFLYWTNSGNIRECDSYVENKHNIIENVWKRLKHNKSSLSITVACDLSKNTARHFRLLKLTLNHSIDEAYLHSVCSKLGHIGGGIASEEFLFSFLMEAKSLGKSEESIGVLEDVESNNITLFNKILQDTSNYFVEYLSDGVLYPSILEVIFILRTFVFDESSNEIINPIHDVRFLLGVSWIQCLKLEEMGYEKISELLKRKLLCTLEKDCNISLPKNPKDIFYLLSSVNKTLSPTIVKKPSLKEVKILHNIDKNICLTIFPILEKYSDSLRGEESLRLGMFLTSWLIFCEDNRWKIISLTMQQPTKSRVQLICPIIMKCIQNYEEKTTTNGTQNISLTSCFIEVVCKQIEYLFTCENNNVKTKENNFIDSATSVPILVELWNLTWRLDGKIRMNIFQSFLREMFHFLSNSFPTLFHDEKKVETQSCPNISNIFIEQTEDEWDSWDEDTESNNEVSDRDMIESSLKYFYENFIMAKESAKICSLSTSDLRILDEIAKVVSER